MTSTNTSARPSIRSSSRPTASQMRTLSLDQIQHRVQEVVPHDHENFQPLTAKRLLKLPINQCYTSRVQTAWCEAGPQHQNRPLHLSEYPFSNRAHEPLTYPATAVGSQNQQVRMIFAKVFLRQLGHQEATIRSVMIKAIIL
jgi:hypothetical protein